MGTLRHPRTNRRVILGARTLIGRLGGCDIRIPHRVVSGEHARIAWLGDGWVLRDLGSTNGTFLGGSRLLSGIDQPLRRGAVICFGDVEDSWVIDEVEPPVLHARPLSGGTSRSAEDELLVLPSEDAPLVTLFRGPEGLWVLEADGETRPVRDRELLMVDGAGWQIFLPSESSSTWDSSASNPASRGLAMRFQISMDEEHIELTVIDRGRSIALGARSHHYLLLLLARYRRGDRDADLSAAEQGWVYREDLLRAMKMSSAQLNMLIFRARKGFAKAGIKGSGSLIERRLSTNQLRLGVADVQEAPLG